MKNIAAMFPQPPISRLVIHLYLSENESHVRSVDSHRRQLLLPAANPGPGVWVPHMEQLQPQVHITRLGRSYLCLFASWVAFWEELISDIAWLTLLVSSSLSSTCRAPACYKADPCGTQCKSGQVWRSHMVCQAAKCLALLCSLSCPLRG